VITVVVTSRATLLGTISAGFLSEIP